MEDEKIIELYFQRSENGTPCYTDEDGARELTEEELFAVPLA